MLKHFFSYLSRNQVIAALFIIGFVALIYQIREILLAVFIAYIIVAALNPIVLFLQKKRVPRALAVLITFFAALCFIVLLIAPLVPFFVSQIQQLAKNFPTFLNEATLSIGFQLPTGELAKLFSPQQIGQNAFAVAGGVFGGFFSVVSTIAISFYLLLSYDKAKKNVASLFHKKHHERAVNVIDQVNNKLGAWLQGQITLSVVIGVLTWVTLTLLGLPYALPLAVLAGLFEIIPTVGPIISAIPAVIVAFTISPNMALIVAGAYILIQMLENHLLVPRIMARAVGLNPVIVIIGVIVGNNLLGIAGALLSVPFISLIFLISKNLDEESHINSAS